MSVDESHDKPSSQSRHSKQQRMKPQYQGLVPALIPVAKSI